MQGQESYTAEPLHEDYTIADTIVEAMKLYHLSYIWVSV